MCFVNRQGAGERARSVSSMARWPIRLEWRPAGVSERQGANNVECCAAQWPALPRIILGRGTDKGATSPGATCLSLRSEIFYLCVLCPGGWTATACYRHDSGAEVQGNTEYYHMQRCFSCATLLVFFVFACCRRESRAIVPLIFFLSRCSFPTMSFVRGPLFYFHFLVS